jgi:hypothetical protein
MRGIQYAAAYRFHHQRLWNTGSSAFADDDSRIQFSNSQDLTNVIASESEAIQLSLREASWIASSRCSSQ